MSFKVISNGGKGLAGKPSEIDIGDKYLTGQKMSQVLGKICDLVCTNILNAIVTVMEGQPYCCLISLIIHHGMMVVPVMHL